MIEEASILGAHCLDCKIISSWVAVKELKLQFHNSEAIVVYYISIFW